MVFRFADGTAGSTPGPQACRICLTAGRVDAMDAAATDEEREKRNNRPIRGGLLLKIVILNWRPADEVRNFALRRHHLLMNEDSH